MAALVLALVFAGCRLDRQLQTPDATQSLDKSSEYLKAHLKDGGLVVFSDWSIDEPKGLVQGTGVRYDLNRRESGPRGVQVVRVSDVALFETNSVRANPGPVAALTVVSLASAALTIACIAHPKSCFGSCPTFYANDGQRDVLMAEGFSASVAPALEATDVDALYRARPQGRTFGLRVTNEALETHVIHQADVLVAPRPPDGHVLATADGTFHVGTHARAPTSCAASEGDCLASVRALDELERGSLADKDNLAARETIDLTFPADDAPGPRGVVIEARQTFITTFLFYQALAYMGHNAGSFLAALERGDSATKARTRALSDALGGIEVQIPDGGGWKTVGAFQETGPLARDLQLIPLPPETRGERVRLRLTKGYWRIGHAALVNVGAEVTPTVVHPTRVVSIHGNADEAADWIAGRRPALVTAPGDAHELQYDLPAPGDSVDIFLRAKGYYLEWMREPWLAEESSFNLYWLLEHPGIALRRLAPAYKRVEPTIENLFWGSRYAPPKG